MILFQLKMEHQLQTGLPRKRQEHSMETVSESRASWALLSDKSFFCRTMGGVSWQYHKCVRKYAHNVRKRMKRSWEIFQSCSLETLYFLIYYSLHIKQCKKYEDAVGALQEWYGNAYKRSKIRVKWQSMRFTEKVMNIVNESKEKYFESLPLSWCHFRSRWTPAFTAINFLETGLWPLRIYQQSK